MARKTITFKSKKDTDYSIDNLDKWVEEGSNNKISQIADKSEKRFTVVLSKKLYKMMKIKCAENEYQSKNLLPYL